MTLLNSTTIVDDTQNYLINNSASVWQGAGVWTSQSSKGNKKQAKKSNKMHCQKVRPKPAHHKLLTTVICSIPLCCYKSA